MTYVVTDACINVKDLSCVEVCPVDCIYFDEVDEMCFVHPEDCINCGVCESACPVGAIFEEEAVPGSAKEFTGINALWFEDKEAARTRIKIIVKSNS